jgi:hypothetical protein
MPAFYIFFLLETLEKRFQLTYNYFKRQSLDINEIRDDRAVTFRDDSLQYDRVVTEYAP